MRDYCGLTMRCSEPGMTPGFAIHASCVPGRCTLHVGFWMLAVIAHCQYEYHRSDPHHVGGFTATPCSDGQFVSLGAASPPARCRTHQSVAWSAVVSLFRFVGVARITHHLRSLRKLWHHLGSERSFTSLLAPLGRWKHRLSDSPVSAETQAQMMTATMRCVPLHGGACQPNLTSNPAFALWLQSTRPMGRVAELGSFEVDN